MAKSGLMYGKHHLLLLLILPLAELSRLSIAET